MKRLKSRGLEERQRWTGRFFVLIWEIGFVWFILLPLVKSFIYSFNDVRITETGFKLEPVGFDKYLYIFNESPSYVENLTESLSSFFTSVPIIFALSLILGIVLNQEFPGRLAFRTIFFLPVIMSTGVILDFIKGNEAAAMMSNMATGGAGGGAGLINVTEIFDQMGIPLSVSELLSKYINTIFDLMWDCGVPIVLFIAGLQSIPESMFEAADVEGATAWERFWYITFPMLSNTSVLVMVFVAISFFVKSNNPVINQAFIVLQQQQVYSVSAAMLWTYFGIVIVLSAIVFLIIDFAWLRRLR
ncbi:MAG: sugar ABC transporter permease [Clostridia bacterium]|nr:sugar ABC transporter permease [Clostridia bacterium]